MKRSEHDYVEIFSWRACVRLLMCALIAFLAVRYWGAVESIAAALFTGCTSIFIGMAIAYIVNIPMRFFEQHLPLRKDGKPRSGVSLGLAILVTAGLLAGLLVIVIPQLVICVMNLAEKAPEIVDSILANEVVAAIVPLSLQAQLAAMDWAELIDEAVAWLQSGIFNAIPQIASAVSQIVAVAMGFVFAMLILGEKNTLGRQAHRIVKTWFGARADERLRRMTALIDECFSRYIIGQSLAAAIMGALTLIVMLILRLPYAATISALVCVLTFVPIIGPIIAMALGALLILPTSWEQSLVFLATNIALQQVQGSLVSPRVINKYVRLDGLWTLVGITLGCALGGIIGAFAGVPLMAAVKRIIEETIARHESAGDQGAPDMEPVLKAAMQSAIDRIEDR